MPKVSIALPNLNTAAYLQERFDTIRNQTFQDWECIVSDNHSNDGSWEIIQRNAAEDPRIICFQSEKDPMGMYPNWNNCLRRCTGEYIHIATSDDTMPPDFLKEMVAALDTHPDCGIAHCPLLAIGDGADEMNLWWRTESLFAKSSEDLIDKPHVRRSPYDALLQLYGQTVIISITQLLIRKSVFDEVGEFEGRWGSIGDFHWHMRACFSTNMVHVPQTWGGWRLHASQATNNSYIGSREHRLKIEEMIDDAIARSSQSIPEMIKVSLQHKWRKYFFDEWSFQCGLQDSSGKAARVLHTFKYILSGSASAKRHVLRSLGRASSRRNPPGTIITEWLGSSFEGLVPSSRP